MFASMQRALAGTRPSPSERERALTALKLRYREGRLSTEELEARVERVYTTVRRSEVAAFLWAMPLQTLRWLTLRKVRRLQTTVLRFHVGIYATLNATVLGVWLLTRRGDLLAGGGPAPDHRAAGVARRALAQAHARPRSPRLVEEPLVALLSEPPLLRSSAGEEHLDVLILGAGLSGIGAACHLHRTFPRAIDRDPRGPRGDRGNLGPVPLSRHPLGLRHVHDGLFLPPLEDARGIADGPSILGYIRDTAEACDVQRLIRFSHRAISASWSSEQARWTVTAQRSDTGEEVRLTCSFLYMCTGYYRYDGGYSPDFAGSDEFNGEVVHPQHWPADLDCAGKRIVVIGSGATAVTLIPSLAPKGPST